MKFVTACPRAMLSLDSDLSRELHKSSFRSVVLSKPQAIGKCFLHGSLGYFYLLFTTLSFNFRNLCSLKKKLLNFYYTKLICLLQLLV